MITVSTGFPAGDLKNTQFFDYFVGKDLLKCRQQDAFILLSNFTPKSFSDNEFEISKPSIFIERELSGSLSNKWNLSGFAFRPLYLIQFSRILESSSRLSITLGMDGAEEKGVLSSE